MSHVESSSPIASKDFYRALTLIWAFLWFFTASISSAELWSSGLLFFAPLAMVVTYALQFRRLPA